MLLLALLNMARGVGVAGLPAASSLSSGNATAKADLCVRHSDCDVGLYCGASGGELTCDSCARVIPGMCDAYDARCCGTTFVAQCLTNPFGCVARGGATGASVGLDQSLVDLAVSVGIPMMEEQLVSGEMVVPDMDDIDVGFLGTRIDLREFVVRSASFEETVAQFSDSADGGIEMRTRVGLDVSVGYVQARRWPLTCTGDMAFQTTTAGSTVAASLVASFNPYTGDPSIRVESTDCSLE